MENGTGSNNTAIGASALLSNTTGVGNTAIGDEALSQNTTGDANTAVGRDALVSDTTGSTNIALGVAAGSNVTTANNVICIGHTGFNTDNSCFIGNIFGSQVGNDAVPVSIDSFGRLGTMTSSRLFKKEIKPMDNASEAILALKPVTFHYKSDKTNTPQFGLIAEEVAEVNPALIVRDNNGKPYTVRYDAVNAMLLNEFLKEHKTMQELKKEIAALTATLKEQDSRIQKVSARIDANKFVRRTAGRIRRGRPAPQIAINP